MTSAMASSVLVPPEAVHQVAPVQIMRARPYKPEDYATIGEWWPAHGWPKIEEFMLPKSGVVIEDATGTPLAAAWLYETIGTSLSLMEWTVTNPANSPKLSVKALEKLIGAVKAMAVGLNYGVVVTTSKHPALIRLLERGGFAQTDTGVTHLLAITIK